MFVNIAAFGEPVVPIHVSFLHDTSKGVVPDVNCRLRTSSGASFASACASSLSTDAARCLRRKLLYVSSILLTEGMSVLNRITCCSSVNWGAFVLLFCRFSTWSARLRVPMFGAINTILHAGYRSVSADFTFRMRRTAAINCIPQLIRGICVIQDNNRTPNSSCTKKDLDILVAVAVHDPYTIAVSQSRPQQRLCDHPAAVSELAIAETRRLPWHN